VEDRRPDRAVAVESAEGPARGDLVRDRLTPLLTPLRAVGPDGQVDLRVQVVVGTERTDQDGVISAGCQSSFSMISSETE
jgi:hypothetical protein